MSRTTTLIELIPFNGKMLDSLTLRQQGLRDYAVLGRHWRVRETDLRAVRLGRRLAAHGGRLAQERYRK